MLLIMELKVMNVVKGPSAALRSTLMLQQGISRHSAAATAMPGMPKQMA